MKLKVSKPVKRTTSAAARRTDAPLSARRIARGQDVGDRRLQLLLSSRAGR